MTVEEPKQLGEIVIEIAGEKLQVAECENGMLLCSENGAGMKKVDCDIFKQELKKKLMRTAEKSSVQVGIAAVPVKKVHKFSKRQERLGEVRRNAVGEMMKIVQYDNNKNITVRFEDGTERKGIIYPDFRQGLVRKPGMKHGRKGERLGEIRKNNAGETMEIVQYNNCKDMTVRFEDGTERKGVEYGHFKIGRVSKPESREEGSSKKKPHHVTRKNKKRLGEIRKNNAGETMQIVQYVNSNNVTVRFEDGTERKRVEYAQFKSGNLRKPERESVGNKEFLQRAEAYLASAKVLLEGKESTLISSIILCKKAAIDFLKNALESRTEGKTSEDETEDIRCLGRKVKEKTGVSLDPRDLAWLNDFNFKQEERWLQPTTEDVTMAIEIVEKIGNEVNKVVQKT